ncbi:MAG: hypothetical protein JWQ63_2243 [Mucilaginibacter sp.]|jgi:hypothetical protein|nr:hypothetical protein [Mucilaginibacter sp.]
MIDKDYKKFGLIISTSLTGTFEALINLISELKYRSVLNPVCILCSLLITVFIMHRIKCYNKDLQIKNLEREMFDEGTTFKDLTDIQQEKIEKCRQDINKLKREKSKIDYFF